jgi:pyruvate formate lyase activating enzyme
VSITERATAPRITNGMVEERPSELRRRAGAGLGALPPALLSGRGDRLRRLRSGEIGMVHSWELVTAVDGPGTRLTLFVNGCPLRCLYCQNPDTLYLRDGVPVRADDVIALLRRYAPIFTTTGGGLTISGGEVLMQPAFAARVLRGAKHYGIHTALDTSGFLGANLTDAALADTDLVLLDIKSGDEATYHAVTGGALEPTLAFGRRLAASGLPGGVTAAHPVEIWIRFVLVPGLTDAWDNVERVADEAAAIDAIRPGAVSRVEVLPFHQLGRDKWHELGRAYALEDTLPPSSGLIERTRAQFRARGLTVY